MSKIFTKIKFFHTMQIFFTKCRFFEIKTGNCLFPHKLIFFYSVQKGGYRMTEYSSLNEKNNSSLTKQINFEPKITLLYIFSFFKGLHFFGSLAVPFYLVRLGFNYTQMFSIEALFSVVLFLAEVPTGVIADKFGRRNSLLLGSIVMGGAFLVAGLTLNILIFITAQIILSIGMALISGADKALLYEEAKRINKTQNEIATINGRYDAISTTAMIIAFPVGSFTCKLQIIFLQYRSWTNICSFRNLYNYFRSYNDIFQRTTFCSKRFCT